MIKAMKLSRLAAAAALALGLFAANLNAATITSISHGTAALAGLVPANSLLTGGGTFAPALGGVVATTTDVKRSPFEADPVNFPSPPTAYYTIASPNTVGSAPSPVSLTYTTPKSVFSILWGSVDTYNGLAFFLGLTPVGSIGGQQLLDAGATQASGASYVTISNFLVSGLFDKVVFTSKFDRPTDGVAFEFAYAVAAVPLPAGALLLVTALGGFGVARRLRKAA